jgi:hypothetical protein
MSKENTRTIDVSTNWEDSVRQLLNLLPHLNPEGVKDAHRQIIHAAKIADLYVERMDGSVMTYGELLEKLYELSPQQLRQEVNVSFLADLNTGGE